MSNRIIDLSRLTRERLILQKHLEGEPFNSDVRTLGAATVSNPVSEDRLGLFRSPTARQVATADLELLHAFEKAGKGVPSFIEAGPRQKLFYDPQNVRAAIVTTGGLAPGLNCVVHSIVRRHLTYGIRVAGKIYGVYDSFKGLCRLADHLVELDLAVTEDWLDQGGSKLGNVRYYGSQEDEHQPPVVRLEKLVVEITKNLDHNDIQILYIIGGDGSLRTALNVAKQRPTMTVVGIPKTMDNDILWVWQSFGFSTAVEQATRTINTMRSEAESTRRVCVIELFGAESGFVAANASLASGHVDLVLIPELFRTLTNDEASSYLERVLQHLEVRVKQNRNAPHAVVVVAEGVATILGNNKIQFNGQLVKKESFVDELTRAIQQRVKDVRGAHVGAFVNQPRHNIRAVPANAHDQTYCERLGSIAVDCALAGYTEFMISQWLTEYVLVPLELATAGQKSIPVSGMFWKQVVTNTGQPPSKAESPTHQSNP